MPFIRGQHKMIYKPIQIKKIVILIILFISTITKFTVLAAPIASKTEKHTVESILGLIHQHGLDTLAIKQRLATIINKPYAESDIALVWAYQLLMADVYSMIHDDTNPTSDYYFKKALTLAKQTHHSELEFVTYARQGHYNFVYRKISKALPLFLQANHLQSKTNLHKTPALVDHYRFIAGFYGHIGYPEDAIKYLNWAIPLSPPKSRARIDMLNSIGLHYQQLGKHNLTLQYLKDALAEAQAGRDTAWIGIISGNLSEYRWQEGKQEEALALLNKNIQFSFKEKDWLDYMRSNLLGATYYVELKDWTKAQAYLDQALTIVKDKPSHLAYQVQAMKIRADIAQLKGNIAQESQCLREYLTLKEQLEQQSNNTENAKLAWKFESDQYIKSIADNEQQQRTIKRTYSLLALLLVLVGTIIVLLLHKAKNTVKIKNIELNNATLKLAIEKQAVDHELNIVKNALNEFTETIKNNNQVIDSLRKELQETSSSDTSLKSRVAAELNNMLQSHLMTQERWVNFRRNFDILHPNYLAHLKEENPLITENDLRIIALGKLGLDNRSMASLLGISPDGVKKAKQRLKKKLSGGPPENTEELGS